MTDTTGPADDAARERAWREWCRSREAALREVPGNLALIANQPLDERPDEIYHLDGITARHVPGEDGVRLEVREGVEASVDGSPVVGEGRLGRLGAGGPFLRSGHYWVDAFSLEGAAYELRIYDEQAPGLADFVGIDTYDYDPALVRRGHFTAYDEVAQVPWEFTKEADAGRPKAVPGRVVVDLPDGPVELVAFRDGGELVFVFADGTTGVESYQPGRFLRIPAPSGDGDVEVDFNRSFVPPCGFSNFYSCPIPPPQNRLTLPIRGGEKCAMWREESGEH